MPYFSQNGGSEKSRHFKKKFRLILFGGMSNFSGAFIHWGKGDERGGGKEPLANGTQYRLPPHQNSLSCKWDKNSYSLLKAADLN